MLKTAIIGAGRRAQAAHYPAVSRQDNLEISAVVELDEARMGEVVDQYSIPRGFGDYNEMLETIDPDAVYIIMGEELMASIAIDIMNAGKHVFIEKPAGASPEESQQLLDAAVSNGVHCMVGYQRRFSATTTESMRLVAERGDPSLIIGEFHKHMLNDPKPPRTTMWNDISHAVDLVRYMSGSEATEVTAFRDRRSSTWTNDYNALLRFDNGAVGIITALRSSGGRTLRGQLHGLGVGCHFDIPESLEIYEDGEGPRMLTGAEIEEATQGDKLAYDGTVAMHRHFAECVRTGATPLTDIRDVIHTSHLVARIEGDER
jgi:predicted dehydrogenase